MMETFLRAGGGPGQQHDHMAGKWQARHMMQREFSPPEVFIQKKLAHQKRPS
jgi:hypothetical protein